MQSPVLLPQPRSLTMGDGTCALAGTRRIVLEAPTSADLLGAGQRLQAALQAAGVSWQLSATPLGGTPPVGATLRVAPERVSHAQGYTLSISDKGIVAEAHDAAGVFYAVCTLVQLVEQHGPALPFVEISDWPDFPARGVMLDISRDKVPTMETLRDLVDMLAGWKINEVQLYTEHTFAYAQHPDVWANASPMTGEDILELDAFCRARFIELVPNQNTFGHMHRWLEHARYHDLAETHDEFTTPWGNSMTGPFSLCPDDPGSIALVRDMLDELLPHFRSRTINIGADETVDLGQGRSKAACEERGSGRVYLDFLQKIFKEVHARGHVAQFWGDIIMHYPELIPDIPQNVIALEWGYEAQHPFAEHGAKFAASGIPFYVCPGTSAWCTLGGRTTNALGNLANAAEHGLRNGAIGYLNTDWGDRGHWQQLPISYLGFAAGAAYSWAWEANRNLDIAAVLSRHAFHDITGMMGALAYELGDVYHAMDVQIGNSTALFWVLQPLKGRSDRAAQVSASNWQQASQSISEIMDRLPESRMNRPDAALVADEFTQTARLMQHACQRGLWLHEEDETQADEQRQALAADMRGIIAEQRRLWLARNQPGGLDDSIARFEKLLAEYEA
jgi:hypothetical protein